MDFFEIHFSSKNYKPDKWTDKAYREYVIKNFHLKIL